MSQNIPIIETDSSEQEENTIVSNEAANWFIEQILDDTQPDFWWIY